MGPSVEDLTELFDECCNNLANINGCLKEVNEFKGLFKKFLDFVKSENYFGGNHLFGTFGMKHIQTYLLKVRKVTLVMLERKDRYCRVKFKELVYRIQFLMEVVPLAYMTSEEDLCSLDADHPRWQALRNITKTSNLSPQIVKAQTEKFLALYNSAKVALYRF